MISMAPNADAHWQSALDHLAENLDTLVDGFLARIVNDRNYAESAVTFDDLLSTGEQSLAAMIDALRSGGTQTAALESLADQLGARRARQGVPLESLIRAVRMDFGVLWEGLAASTSGLSAEHLVGRGELVWKVVDVYASHVQTRYVQEQTELERADVDLQQHYLAQLFGTQDPTSADISRISGALRIQSDSAFRVVALGRDDSATVQRRLRVQPGSERVFSIAQGHHTLVIRELPARSHVMDVRERKLYDGVSAAVAPIADGLASVREAGMAAREIMRDLPVGAKGIFSLRDRVLSIARHRLTQVGCDPARTVLDGLEKCPTKERERILEAVAMFLETGSLVETSRRLFCHRNTIVNRLAAFERYTELDLKLPRDVAIAVLVLGS
ncbi:helix-turn-helix domain-containing protein (plasmid) [Arthrobacter sp. UC242_113]|uniref:helix-turn-helix domain-containing protein n=1 Tax=Arthrobacter sp. UC242_113 TaxID=3374550 RepID=UPI003756A47C